MNFIIVKKRNSRNGSFLREKESLKLSKTETCSKSYQDEKKLEQEIQDLDSEIEYIQDLLAKELAKNSS